jgi:CDP-paratose 2-epimerase
MLSRMKALVTGSGGLIGSACARALCGEGWTVHGVDNDMRRRFFGDEGSVAPEIASLRADLPAYRHAEIDMRDRQAVRDLVAEVRPDFIVHAAAQPSHEKAASIPYEDFDVNGVGTLNLLVATRDFCRDSPFCFMSSNKVYGDNPNRLPLVETDSRYDYADGRPGIDETMSIDACRHTLFGASKLAADVLCQEFARAFQMPVGIFRAGCLTGPRHAAVELHGFLAYIVFCAATGRPYTLNGYGGKQVRDQLHCGDAAALFLEFYRNPRPAEVYNLGGGRENSLSILETIRRLKDMGLSLNYEYRPENRAGDHVCYISDLGKVKAHFPNWSIRYPIEKILEEVVSRYPRAS